MFNEQNEIRGDEIEAFLADVEREEGYEACPVDPITDEDVEAHAEDWQARMNIKDPTPARREPTEAELEAQWGRFIK